MPTAFCALDDAYGDWTKKPSQVGVQKTPTEQKNALNVYNGSESMGGIRSFCPNCSNCLNANNMLQQKIIEQNIWPRPRWIPQNPHAYEAHDPYNRYWMDNYNPQRREEFGGSNYNQRENFGSPMGSLFNIERFGNMNNSEGLLQLILFILVVLFVIQLFEMVFRLSGSN